MSPCGPLQWQTHCSTGNFSRPFFFVSSAQEPHTHSLSHPWITSKNVCLGLQPVWVKTKINCKLATAANKHAHLQSFLLRNGRRVEGPGSPPYPVLTQQIADGSSWMEGARALPASIPQGGVQRGRTGGTDSPCSPVTRQFPQPVRLTTRGHSRHGLSPPASHQAASTLPRGARPPGLPAHGQNAHPCTCGTKVRILLPFSSLPLVDTVQLPEAARASCRVAPCAVWVCLVPGQWEGLGSLQPPA